MKTQSEGEEQKKVFVCLFFYSAKLTQVDVSFLSFVIKIIRRCERIHIHPS